MSERALQRVNGGLGGGERRGGINGDERLLGPAHVRHGGVDVFPRRSLQPAFQGLV